MQRQWMVDRIVCDEETNSYGRVVEGDQAAQQLGLALAATCSEALLESLLSSVAALNQFGGQVYIVANRRKFGSDGRPIKEGIGDYETTGYAFHYGHRRTAVKGAEVEPDDELPMPLGESAGNGVPAEPVEAAS